MKEGSIRRILFVVAIAVVLVCFLVKANNSTIRLNMNYKQGSILANPAGTCAIVEYKFAGGERGIDLSQLLQIADGNAFYRVIDLRTGKTILDSSNAIPGITAYSLETVAMGDSVFYWSKDGKSVNFPGEKPDYFYEWTNIDECEGAKGISEFASQKCHSDSSSPICSKIKTKL